MEPSARARAIDDMPPTDADAIRRSLDEPAAFGAVFDRHYAAVHAYAQRRVGAELAEEVAAEAFARAFAPAGATTARTPTRSPGCSASPRT